MAEQITEAKVKEALRQLPNTKAPRPDGMQGSFLKRFWAIMKHDVMNLFEKFMANEVDLSELNFIHSSYSLDFTSCAYEGF